MLAALDANGIAFIVGAIGVVLMQLLTSLLDYFREQNRIKRDQEVLHNVKVIEVATNSMKDALVLATEKEALARGISQGARDQRARDKDD